MTGAACVDRDRFCPTSDHRPSLLAAWELLVLRTEAIHMFCLQNSRPIRTTALVMFLFTQLRQLARNKLPATLTRSVSVGRAHPSLTLRVGILFSASCLTLFLLCSPALAADTGLDAYNHAVGLYKLNRWELAAKAFEKFIESDIHDGVFNIGGGPKITTSLNEYLDLMETLGVKRPQTSFKDWRPSDQKVYITDTTKVQKALNWPQTS